ncbi:MAG: YraN family protein [Lachnospiraceae bacterium]|nr:YraN family protein [Lachnospiraceae bacterium]
MAADFLQENGIRIIERNYRCRMGEIDIIGFDGDTRVFFEVKYRKNADSGHPCEAVGFTKQRTICRTADHYRMVKRLPVDMPYRFDIISISGSSVEWYKNAFEYIE